MSDNLNRNIKGSTPIRRRMRRDWPPFEVVIFDCDSTLTTIEGIDELAGLNGRKADISALTEQAMNGTVPLETVYRHRLELLRVTRAQVRQLRPLYRKNVVPGASAVIAALLAHECEVFIVSGGLAEAIKDFGRFLGVPAGAGRAGMHRLSQCPEPAFHRWAGIREGASLS
ncbi:MAG: HAD family hydrolase [Anaerolineales bacterium]